MNRVEDNEGHLWPITDRVCTTCKWPMIPVGNNTIHPNCTEESK